MHLELKPEIKLKDLLNSFQIRQTDSVTSRPPPPPLVFCPLFKISFGDSIQKILDLSELFLADFLITQKNSTFSLQHLSEHLVFMMVKSPIGQNLLRREIDNKSDRIVKNYLTPLYNYSGEIYSQKVGHCRLYTRTKQISVYSTISFRLYSSLQMLRRNLFYID